MNFSSSPCQSPDRPSSSGSDSDRLVFIQQNVRSLRKNFDEVVSHVQALSRLPGLLFFTETWIYSDEIDHFNLENYSAFHNCNDSYKAGGVSA